MPIQVAIVEDQDEIRTGLSYLINGSDGFRCVSAYGTAEEALADLPQRSANVVLMDIELPGMSGIACIRELKRLLPDLHVMMLTVFEDDDKIFQSLVAGASGYILKKTPPAALLDAIRDLHDGGSPMSSQIARKVVQAFQQPSGDHGLTKREQEILGYLARGYRYKEVAAAMFISVETVRTHIRNIYDKLQVRSRTEALLKLGLR